MRVFVLTLFVGVALAAPQGYNYQVHLGPNDGSEFTLDQYQLLQQFADQQQLQQQYTAQQFQLPPQAQIIAIPANVPELSGATQAVTQSDDNSDYHLVNQLVQQAHIAQYEQQQQQQQSQQQTEQLPQPQQQEPAQPQQAQQPQVAAAPPVQTNLLSTPLEDGQQAPQLQQPAQPTQAEQLLLQEPQQQLQLQPESQEQLQLAQLPHQAAHQQQYQAQVQYTPPPPPPATPAPTLAAPAPTQAQHYQTAPLHYNKEFYYLSAPQEDYDQSPELQDQLGKLKKHLRVVFIKAPEQNGLAKAALQLAQGATSAQTAIYVLTKQHDVAEFANKLQQIRASSHAKPEVVFVKYRTPEEADQAQRTIQSQYEALDGPNHFNHDGVVPTHNFIGSTAAVEPRKRPADEANTPASKYLPAAAKS